MVVQEEFIQTSEFESIQDLAQRRFIIYSFLSSVYCHCPNKQTIKKLFSQDMSEFLGNLTSVKQEQRQVGQGLQLIKEYLVEKEAMKHTTEELQTELAVEFTKLLRGLKPGYGPKPPYESLYRSLSKDPSREIMREIRRFYAELGVAHDLCDQPDFIGLELELMRYLVERETEGWEKGLRNQVITSLEKQLELLENHLSCWVPDFCTQMYEHAREKYYKGIALITQGFIADDLDQLKNTLEIAKG